MVANDWLRQSHNNVFLCVYWSLCPFIYHSLIGSFADGRNCWWQELKGPNYIGFNDDLCSFSIWKQARKDLNLKASVIQRLTAHNVIPPYQDTVRKLGGFRTYKTCNQKWLKKKQLLESTFEVTLEVSKHIWKHNPNLFSIIRKKININSGAYKIIPWDNHSLREAPKSRHLYTFDVAIVA